MVRNEPQGREHRGRYCWEPGLEEEKEEDLGELPVACTRMGKTGRERSREKEDRGGREELGGRVEVEADWGGEKGRGRLE